ncbi:GNAT family N-acetyltransferase [Actinophytocola sp.]|uniref:GNAT family N-acetyltransferase n=1 Tax=Actinophytocola sp. TaxID=1872138 RepID=UPI002ED039B5
MTIAAAADADAGEVLTVQRAAYVSEARLYDNPHLSALTESLASVREAIASEIVLVARAGTRIVGAVRGRVEGTVCHVGRLVVAPDVQGMGLGRRLLLAVEARVPASVRTFALFTGDRSASNLGLYRKLGYKRVREERVADTLSLIHLEKTVP